MTLMPVLIAAADFKRHVSDVEAALARKTDEIHQYRHKLEAELSGTHTIPRPILIRFSCFLITHGWSTKCFCVACMSAYMHAMATL